MLHRILFVALVAGLLSGIVASVFQHFVSTPIILQAENYEFSSDVTMPKDSHASHNIAPHETEVDSTDDDNEMFSELTKRTIFTSIGTTASSFAFVLIVLSLMILSSVHISIKSGLFWGIAGFVSFAFAPALGLAPELPGAAVAELTTRQIWWLSTVLATALSLWIIFQKPSPISIPIALFIAAIPHIIGAPHINEFFSDVPAEIASHFVSVSLFLNALMWTTSCSIAGYLWNYYGYNDQNNS